MNYIKQLHDLYTSNYLERRIGARKIVQRFHHFDNVDNFNNRNFINFIDEIHRFFDKTLGSNEVSVFYFDNVYSSTTTTDKDKKEFFSLQFTQLDSNEKFSIKTSCEELPSGEIVFSIYQAPTSARLRPMTLGVVKLKLRATSVCGNGFSYNCDTEATFAIDEDPFCQHHKAADYAMLRVTEALMLLDPTADK